MVLKEFVLASLVAVVASQNCGWGAAVPSSQYYSQQQPQPQVDPCSRIKKRSVVVGVSEEAKKYIRKKRQVDSKTIEAHMGQPQLLSTCRNAQVQSILRKRISSDVETSMFRIRDNLNAECLSNYLVVCSTKGKAFSYKSRLASLCSHSNGMVACFVFEM
ncbi:hypothetical protein L596_015711 [Steinernema carpocapsae]|uniref:Ground-like domain-containing protein n=1 Tax=Steinernema carpocapsae TaxID=34508 RepID=A0A4V6A371_STECR|nr:hypothetical protein L596_015711 [Steinernema carpocapsae]